MNNLLIILYSLLDSEFWQLKQITSWADKAISDVDKPRLWLIELSLTKTSDEALTTISKAVNDFWMTFPEEMEGLLIGFTILRYEKGEISDNEMRKSICEILDTYESLDVYDDEEFESLLGQGGDEYNAYKKEALRALELLNQYMQLMDCKEFLTSSQ